MKSGNLARRRSATVRCFRKLASAFLLYNPSCYNVTKSEYCSSNVSPSFSKPNGNESKRINLNIKIKKSSLLTMTIRKHYYATTSDREMYNKDLYGILQVKPTATQEELKKAFYKQAMKYHPDRAKDAASQKTFTEMSNAYEILKDSDTRKKYDAHRQSDATWQTRSNPSSYRGAATEDQRRRQSQNPNWQNDEYSDWYRQRYEDIFSELENMMRAQRGFGNYRPNNPSNKETEDVFKRAFYGDDLNGPFGHTKTQQRVKDNVGSINEDYTPLRIQMTYRRRGVKNMFEQVLRMATGEREEYICFDLERATLVGSVVKSNIPEVDNGRVVYWCEGNYDEQLKAHKTTKQQDIIVYDMRKRTRANAAEIGRFVRLDTFTFLGSEVPMPNWLGRFYRKYVWKISSATDPYKEKLLCKGWITPFGGKIDMYEVVRGKSHTPLKEGNHFARMWTEGLGLGKWRINLIEEDRSKRKQLLRHPFSMLCIPALWSK